MFFEFIEYSDDNLQTLKRFLKRRCETEKELNLDPKGSNPEVFYYQFHKSDEFGFIGLKMVFYGSAEAYFTFMGKESKEPFNLGIKLMNEGFHTFLEIGDEKFEFNKKTPSNNV